MAATPEERVAAYGADYYASWKKVARRFDRQVVKGFARWSSALEGLEQRHLAPGTDYRIENSFGRPAPYRPGGETTTQVTTDGDTATVRTAVDEALESIREYELVRVGGDWLIHRIALYNVDPELPYLTAEKAAERLAACSAQAPLGPLGEQDLVLVPAALFAAGRDVRDAGTLTTSGALTISDLGYDNDDARPLLRTVAPGTHHVQVVVEDDCNAALRVLLGPGEPVAWHPAATVHGNVFGVDAGNLCVADYASYAALVRRDKERASEVLARSTNRPTVQQLAFGVVAESGWGDGAYPALWGVDAAGTPVQLVIDFLVGPAAPA